MKAALALVLVLAAVELIHEHFPKFQGTQTASIVWAGGEGTFSFVEDAIWYYNPDISMVELHAILDEFYEINEGSSRRVLRAGEYQIPIIKGGGYEEVQRVCVRKN